MKTRCAVLKGKTAFPVDMLRYDRCFPAREADSKQILLSIENNTTGIYLDTLYTVCVCFEFGTQLSFRRWEAFGWTCNTAQRNMPYVTASEIC